MKRKDPTLTEKLAAFVLTMRVEEDGKLVPLVDREHAKQMTAHQIVSLLQVDHDPIPVAIAVKLGMSPAEYNHPTNLTPRAIRDHREKTAKVDVPAIAKSDRITAEQADFRRAMLAKASGEPAPERRKYKRKWPSRPFPKQQRGMNR